LHSTPTRYAFSSKTWKCQIMIKLKKETEKRRERERVETSLSLWSLKRLSERMSSSFFFRSFVVALFFFLWQRVTEREVVLRRRMFQFHSSLSSTFHHKLFSFSMSKTEDNKIQKMHIQIKMIKTSSLWNGIEKEPASLGEKACESRCACISWKKKWSERVNKWWWKWKRRKEP